MSVKLHSLKETPVVTAPSGAATPRPWSANFYDDLDKDFSGFAGHRLIAEHGFSEPWPTWEMHPAGDEIVYLLSGDTDFVFWINGAEQVLRFDKPGSYVVVPKGVWHTARPRAESRMLFITPGEGTLNEAQPR